MASQFFQITAHSLCSLIWRQRHNCGIWVNIAAPARATEDSVGMVLVRSAGRRGSSDLSSVKTRGTTVSDAGFTVD
eukprot:1148949-Pleurochrysis_carterae.AAC.1